MIFSARRPPQRTACLDFGGNVFVDNSLSSAWRARRSRAALSMSAFSKACTRSRVSATSSSAIRCVPRSSAAMFFDRHRRILRLNQQLRVFPSLVDRQGRHGVHIAAEFGERLQLAVLRLIDLQRTGHFLHRLDLGVTTHTRHGNTHVDGRTVALVEEVRLEEDLPVGDRNHVRRDIGRHVARLRLDDREAPSASRRP